LIKKGKNYGWPVITYGREYWGPSIGEGTHKEGMEQPLKVYTPSIAPCGMTFYFGDKFPAWNGSLFSGSLKFRHLNRLEIRGNKVITEERLLKELDKRIRDIVQGPLGFIYLSTDDGFILRLRPYNKS
ncbi:MAG: PQQ-dependent sugar dehydrogenase, partial [Halobacteriovoraceae bacterium]|nr:PQQ-dependent sugar dehydrogenase [Halobacteriovoraceae bacterium]